MKTATLSSLLDKMGGKEWFQVGAGSDDKQAKEYSSASLLHSTTMDNATTLKLAVLVSNLSKQMIENIPVEVQSMRDTTYAENQAKKDKLSKKKKRKKTIKPQKQTLTFVVPCAFDQHHLKRLTDAVRHTELCSSSLQPVVLKSFFNRGICVVAAQLYKAQVARLAIAQAARMTDATPQVGNYFTAALDSQSAEGPALAVYFNATSVGEDQVQVFYEACLVRCEAAQQQGTLLGYERLWAISTTAGKVAKDKFNSTTMEQALTVLLSQAALTTKDIAVVILDGEAQSYEAAALKTTSSQCFKATESDAAMGASILAAAELDSTKMYLELEGEWTIIYQLPVADGILQSVDVGLYVEEDEEDLQVALKSKAGSVEIACAADRRLFKADLGRVRSTAASVVAPVVVRKEFQGGSAYFPSGHKHSKCKLGWPKLHILQRPRTAGAGGDQWEVIASCSPLSSSVAREEGQAPVQERVQTCSVVVEMDSATGLVKVTETKSPTMRQIRAKHLWIFQLLLFVFLPFLLYGAWKVFSFFSAWYVTSQHKAWLVGFYAANAPEKLQDPEYIMKTLKKYEGKMFLLYRSLERTYQVKWHPPTSIVDDL